jgi:predicted transcriptional regulator
MIHTKNWSGLDSTDAIAAALVVLVDYGWVTPLESKFGGAGRPTIKYRANVGIGEALL